MTKAAPLRVVITGASSGIGTATAEAFAATGAHLFLATRGAEVGAPTSLLVHAQAPTSKLGTAILSGSPATYFRKSDPAPTTEVALFDAGKGGEIDGGFRDPDRGKKAAVAGTLGVAAAAAGALAWWTSRRSAPA